MHHVDPSDILFHLFSVLHALTIDHVVNVLDFIWAQVRKVWLRSLLLQDRLVDRGQLVVLVGASRNESLTARVTSLVSTLLAYTSNIG